MSAAAERATSKGALIALAVAIVVCFAASFIGNAFTQPNLDWYATLTKPGFTPPNSLFPIVWTVLYLAMAVAVWLVWRAPRKDENKRPALVAFGVQLLIGVMWSVAFFGMQSPGAGLVVIMVYLIAIIVTIILFDRVNRAGALLMLPLALWVAFATALNTAIWALNRGLAFSVAP
jgi:translocator protein